MELNLTKKDLPILIHGEDKLGASLYTMSLAANLHSQGNKILFLCGYAQAREEFTKQVGEFDDSATFFVKEGVENFKNTLPQSGDRIVIIKNIELFDENIFKLIKGAQNLIVSGDVGRCSFGKALTKETFATKVFFSELDGFDVPKLEKYAAFFTSKNLQGITTAQVV